MQAGIDQRLTVADLTDGDRPDLRSSIRSDDPDVGAIRTLLNCRRGNRQAIVPRGQKQSRIDELAWPEPTLRIGEVGAQLNCAGGLNDLIVDEDELALVELGLVILAVGVDRKRAFRHLLLDLGECFLREREDHRDRLNLRDIDKAVRISRMNDVADIDLANAGDAIDRRGELGVAQIDAGRIDQRFVRFDRGLQLAELSLLRFDQLGRRKPLCPKLGVAIEIGLRIDQLGLIALAVGDRLVELCLIGARINLGQRVTLVHGLSLLE